MEETQIVHKVSSNFLEISVISEVKQMIEQIENNCKGKKGEDIVKERVRQLAYAKLLCHIYKKDITYLIKASTQLGIAYLDIEYYEQAQEHLLDAFKLNENLTEENSIKMKEYQIKILINLSKCYIENDKALPGLQLSERSLKMNQILFGLDHVSNADIYYVISRAHLKLNNYQSAIENLKNMFDIYEKVNGLNSDKTAKICLEIAQVYDLWEKQNEALEYYLNSYNIWEKIIDDNNYEILFKISIKVAEIYQKLEKQTEAYDFLYQTDEKYSSRMERSIKDRFIYQKYRIKYSSSKKNINIYLEENLKLEEILNETNENRKTLARTCISIAYAYLEIGNEDKCFEYLGKAENIFTLNGDVKYAKEIKQRKMNIKNRQMKNISELINDDEL